MTEKEGCTPVLAYLRSARQQLVDPAEQPGTAGRYRRGQFGEGAGAAGTRLARPRRQVLVGGRIAHLGHEVVAAARGDHLRHRGTGIAEIAEMTRRGGARRDAGRHAVGRVAGLVVDAVDAQRAFLHDADILAELAGPVWAKP